MCLMQRIVALTFFTMFSLVTSLTHTFVSLVHKSNQASCIVMAQTETTLVLVKTYFAFHEITEMLYTLGLIITLLKYHENTEKLVHK